MLEGEGEREGGGRAVAFDELAPHPNGVALDLVAICN